MKWVTNRVTEEYAMQGLALGVQADMLEQIDRCARFIGPRTTLRNGEIYSQVWTYALHRVKGGDKPLPSDAIVFARGLIAWMYYGVLVPEMIFDLLQVRDAYAAFLQKESIL